MEIIQIPLDSILQDDTYRFSSPDKNNPLKHSIQQYGVLQPVHLFRWASDYIIIAGFKRVEIAKQLKLSYVPAYIASAPDSLTAFVIGLSEHLSINRLNIIEKARILRILEADTNRSVEIKQKIYPRLHISLPEKQIPQLLNLLNLHPDMIAYIEMYDTSVKQAFAFVSYHQDEQCLFVRMALALKIRIVELESIVSLFCQISKREDESVHTIYHKLKVDKILQNERLSRSQKIQAIKTQLIQKRFPKLSEWQASIQTYIESLSVPSHTDILWDKNLEHPGITLKTNLKTKKDLQALSVFLNDPANQEIILNLLKMSG